MRFELPLNGHRSIAELALPAIGDVLSLWMEQHLRTPSRAAILQQAEISRFLARVDDQPVGQDMARAIAADTRALSTYRAARNRALQSATEGGMLYARCPHCREWEADLSPLALAVGLRAAFWPVSDPDGQLAVPALSRDATRVLPPDIVSTAELSFVLPRHTESRVRGVFAQAERASRFAAYGAEFSALFAGGDDVEDWIEGSPGAIALVRLASVVRQLPEPVMPGSIQAFAAVALGDFAFIDNLYYLTHCAELPPDSPLALACERCQGQFLPLV
jgi:hypothetical protein